MCQLRSNVGLDVLSIVRQGSGIKCMELSKRGIRLENDGLSRKSHNVVAEADNHDKILVGKAFEVVAKGLKECHSLVTWDRATNLHEYDRELLKVRRKVDQYLHSMSISTIFFSLDRLDQHDSFSASHSSSNAPVVLRGVHSQMLTYELTTKHHMQ
jgi:hypothetical protein